MNSRKLLLAFSYIDDDWLSLAEDKSTAKRTKPRLSKTISSFAAVLVLIITIGIGAWALREFNSLDGDDLLLSAHYEGAGIVSIEVENRSNVDLRFQPMIRLQRWSTSEEIQRISDDIVFSNTVFKAGETGAFRIDLSKAYDLDVLETPLKDDWYVITLTNHAFLFGQDWMCSVDFSEPIKTEAEEPMPLSPVTPALQTKDAPVSAAEIMDELQPYFEEYVADYTERNALAAEYLMKCQTLLGNWDKTVVPSISPLTLTIKEPEEVVIFDSSVPSDMQLQLTGLHSRTVDGYGKKIGSTDMEEALVLSVQIPQHKDEIDGVEIPLLFIFTYDAGAIENTQDYAFIRGQLLTFEQMEKYKVYEDGQYVCYNVTALFYSDLRSYVDSIISQRSDVYCDDQIWSRIQNVYNYYNQHLPELLTAQNNVS